MWTKQTLISVLFLLVTQGLTVQGTIKKSNAITYFSDRMVKVIQNKCLNNTNDTVSEEAISEFFAFQNCWQLALPNKDYDDDEFYNYCLSYMAHSIECLEKFVQHITPCLEPEEDYIPKFILEGYGNYNHFMCKFFLEKGASKEKIDRCTEKFNQHKQLDPVVACYENSTIFGSNVQHLGIITKAKLCSDIRTLATCTENLLDAHCTDVGELKTLRLYPFKNSLEICK